MDTIQVPELTRRVFLSRTLQALGAAAVMPLASCATAPATSSAAAAGGTAAETGVPQLRFLTPGQYLTLEAMSDTIIPGGGAFEPGARDLGLAARVDAYLPKFDPAVAQGIRGALVFVEEQAPALAQQKAPFSSLSDEDRVAVCKAMLAAGDLPAGILLAMKWVSMSFFYTMDATWQYTGYDGPMLQEGSR